MTRLPEAVLRLFSSLEGWADADLAGFWPPFQAGALAIVDGTPSLRAARPPDAAMVAIARQAASLPSDLSQEDVRSFMERYLQPFTIDLPGFVTGYYEPVVEGSLTRTAALTAPVLPRPEDLVTIGSGEDAPGLPPGYAAARRMPDDTLEPYAERAVLEAQAMGPDANPIVWLRDWTEVFLIQVQGSARVRLADGSQRRLVYAGRNGHPYTSIGKLLVDAGEIQAEDMSLDTLKGWLRRHGQEDGERGRTVMHANRSFIFFELAPAGACGPTGGAGLPLTPHRSIAVDRAIWAYGLPFWIETDQTLPGFGMEPVRRLFVAQDTGSAIVGPARADLFLGSGDAAGRDAGSIRHSARVTVLLPRGS